MSGADGDTLAAGGAAATEHGGAGIGLHARPETVSFGTVAAVGLKCTFGHGNPLLFSKENLFFTASSAIACNSSNRGRSTLPVGRVDFTVVAPNHQVAEDAIATV